MSVELIGTRDGNHAPVVRELPALRGPDGETATEEFSAVLKRSDTLTYGAAEYRIRTDQTSRRYLYGVRN